MGWGPGCFAPQTLLQGCEPWPLLCHDEGRAKPENTGLPSGKKTPSSLRFETELNIFGWVVLNSSSVTQGMLPAHLNRGFLSRRFCEEPPSPVVQHKVHFFKGAHTETCKYFKDNYVKNASFLSFFPRGVGYNNRIRKPNSWRLLAVPPDL